MLNATMLLGLGDASGTQAAIDGLLLRAPNPTSSDLTDFLKPFPAGAERNAAAQDLLARGVNAKAVSGALSWLEASEKFNFGTVWNVLSVASMGVSVYHGYKRNNSIGWALMWGLAAVVLPVVTPVVAVAQGFGKRKASS